MHLACQKLSEVRRLFSQETPGEASADKTTACRVMRLMTGARLVAQLLGLLVVLPENLRVFLQGPTVIVVLLPVMQRPSPVCHDARVQVEDLAADLLHSCNTQACCVTEQDSVCHSLLVKA